jgi:hypothetical protein
MRISFAIFPVMIFFLLLVVLSQEAQTQVAPQAAASPVTTPPSSAVPSPPVQTLPARGASVILKPSLVAVEQTLSALKIEKWKRGTVRDEAAKNIAAILRDIQTNLPPLASRADEVPEAVSKVLPMSRNVDALYDVLLRVDEASRVSAPGEQIAQIEQVLDGLKTSRLALDDHLQELAAAAEKQMVDLQAKLQAQAATKCPATPTTATSTCAAPTPAHKVKRKPKPAAASTSASPAPAAATPKTQN